MTPLQARLSIGYKPAQFGLFADREASRQIWKRLMEERPPESALGVLDTEPLDWTETKVSKHTRAVGSGLRRCVLPER